MDVLVVAAVSAGYFFGFEDGDTSGPDETGDGLLDLCVGESFYGVGVIGDSVEGAATGDDGDTDAIDLRVEKIFTMAFGVHPESVNALRRGSHGDVFFNEAEVRAGVGGAGGEIGRVGVLVRDGAFGGHAQTVLSGSCGECGIPGEGVESGFSAGAVGGVEEDLSFRLNALDRLRPLGDCERGEDEREQQGDEGDKDSQERWCKQQFAGEARAQFPLVWIEIQRASPFKSRYVC